MGVLHIPTFGCLGWLTLPQQPALGYMQIVAARDATTLLPIINSHVASGTIVHSDEWAAYIIECNHLPNVNN